ncbi:hypothetical protein SDC9_212239 [bioreactor metagenome]|uniref:Uncharacterized protein n=1 Tax=bioreactor metagenome TaxID=1076179 RepID=A0A645JY55_9ZZZZ
MVGQRLRSGCNQLVGPLGVLHLVIGDFLRVFRPGIDRLQDALGQGLHVVGGPPGFSIADHSHHVAAHVYVPDPGLGRVVRSRRRVGHPLGHRRLVHLYLRGGNGVGFALTLVWRRDLHPGSLLLRGG